MGFKKTSELIAVSFGVTESAPGVFTQEEVALQLDVLNNEIAVILAVDLDLEEPDGIAGVNTRVQGSISSTSLTSNGGLNQTNVIAVGKDTIRAQGFIDAGVGFSRKADSSYTGDLPYLALIATNNFFAQIEGNGNPGVKSMSGRVWLYRAKADSSTYAALVQSEVLSA
jgi:hypothetical protein